MTRSQDPRVHELLAERALHGLDDADERELHALGGGDDASYDLAAAAIELATLAVEPMPAELAERVAAAAPSPAFAPPHTLAGWLPAPGPMPPAPAPVAAPVPPAPRRAARRRSSAVTWFATAASILVVTGVAWWLLRGQPGPPAAPTVAQARAQLLASAPDAATLAWQPTKDAPAATGDVVWSASAQRGYMRFVGLPANDPARTQYQLWIFDRLRDQAFPVDGGVFDVGPAGEVIVPITAKLHVDDATLFAVTIERPGGVVVSKREHIVVTAART